MACLAHSDPRSLSLCWAHRYQQSLSPCWARSRIGFAGVGLQWSMADFTGMVSQRPHKKMHFTVVGPAPPSFLGALYVFPSWVISLYLLVRDLWLFGSRRCECMGEDPTWKSSTRSAIAGNLTSLKLRWNSNDVGYLSSNFDFLD